MHIADVSYAIVRLDVMLALSLATCLSSPEFTGREQEMVHEMVTLFDSLWAPPMKPGAAFVGAVFWDQAEARAYDAFLEGWQTARGKSTATLGEVLSGPAGTLLSIMKSNNLVHGSEHVIDTDLNIDLPCSQLIEGWKSSFRSRIAQHNAKPRLYPRVRRSQCGEHMSEALDPEA